jgi:hypothetical protein
LGKPAAPKGPPVSYGDFIPGGIDETPAAAGVDPSQTSYAVQSPDGVVGEVPAAELGQALDAGFQRVDAATLQAAKEKADRDARLNTVGSTLAATGEGVARGLTFGASDAAAIYGTKLFDPKAGDAVRQHLEEQKAAHPIASTVGEIGGAAIPLVLSAGAAAPLEAANAARMGVEGAALAREAGIGAKLASGAARAGEALGLPTRAVAEAGALAEKGAAKGISALFGESAQSLGARIAQKVATKGIQGATEGALIGAAQAVDESVLGDTKLTGEKLFSAGVHGALLGGTFGGVLGGAGELGTAILGKVAPKLSAAAEENAVQALNARKKFTTLMEEVPGGRKAMGRALIDEVGIEAGDTVATIAPKIEAAKAAAAENLSRVVEKVESKGVPLADAIKALNKRATEFETQMGYEAAAAAVRKQSDNLARITGVMGPDGLPDYQKLMNATVPLKDLLAARRSLEGTINWQTDTVVAKGIKAAGRTLEDVVMDHGEQAAKAAGSTFKAEYQAAKTKYRQMALADEIAQDSVSRMNANASHSLTDKIFGAAAGAVGLHGGGPIGGLVTSAAVGNASKFVRERGRATAAVMLDKLSAIGGVERAAAAVDREIDRGVAGFFEPGSRAKPRLKATKYDAPEDAKVPGGSYAKRVENVARAVANAHDHVEATRTAVGGIAQHAPQTAVAFQQTALRATTYLHDAIPKGHRDLTSLTPQTSKDGDGVPHYAKAEFNRKYDVVNGGPVVLLHHMANGTLTKGEVEAADAVYPEAMKDVRNRVIAKLADQKHPLPYAKDIQARLLLNLPRTGTTLDPKFVGTMQQTFHSQPQKPGGGGAPHSAPKHQLGSVLSAAATLTGQGKT